MRKAIERCPECGSFSKRPNVTPDFKVVRLCPKLDCPVICFSTETAVAKAYILKKMLD